MPFKSKAQARYLFSQEPNVAKEFAAKTPSVKKLPERVGPKDPSKNKPVSPAFKKGKKGSTMDTTSQPLSSYDANPKS
jgi:hypothetical protein